MKRSSVVAPLLLIGVGLLFLARNMYPDLALIDYFARYWPTLLILWGVLRLAEILFWAATEKELPARGMTGGEWILIFLLCLIGLSVHTVRGFESWWPRSGITMGGIDMFGESFDYPISGEKQVGKAPRVIIESFRGNARITGSDANTVKVTGHKSIRSLEQSCSGPGEHRLPVRAGRRRQRDYDPHESGSRVGEPENQFRYGDHGSQGGDD